MWQPDLEVDQFNLRRFFAAQQPLYATILNELRSGRKRSHWMWFVFPQVDGLGHSPMARAYAIHSRGEAIAYLANPLLGARLLECTRLVLDQSTKSAHEIFGSPDDLKFRSSMTLFAAVDNGNIYGKAIDRFFDGNPDAATRSILERWELANDLR